MNRIIEATPQSHMTLHLKYKNGEEKTVDLKPVIEKGGVFSSLNDPKIFSQVKIGEGGRYIEWPGLIDLCADALYSQHASAVK